MVPPVKKHTFRFREEKGVCGKNLCGFFLHDSNHPARRRPGQKEETRGACLLFLERLMGVEPTYAAWEAAVLPMNYSRVNGAYYNSSVRKKQAEN